MSLIEENVYLGRDNQIDLTLTMDEADFPDHSVITRIEILVGRGGSFLSADPFLVIDSDANPTWFGFTNTAYVTLKLGASTLPRGRHLADLIVYTAAYPTGMNWMPQMWLNVR